MAEGHERVGAVRVAEDREDADPGGSEGRLILEVQRGSDAAFAVLYSRFRPTALRAAERYLAAHHRSQAEDVVEVTFTSIYNALRRGHGPKGSFRSYLLLSVRREATRHQQRRDRETVMESASLDTVGRSVLTESPVSGDDPRRPDFEGRPGQVIDPELLLGDVFRGLNGRFQQALWLSEVEGRRPEDLAPMLGISPNAAAALCYRARRALRAGYFRAYAATVASPTCKPLIAGLAAFVEAGQPTVGHASIRSHLEGCAACRDVARGSVRSGSILAALGPFGLLSAGAWLDPEQSEPDPSGRWHARGYVSVAAVILLVLGLVTVVVWPNGGDDTEQASAPDAAAERPVAGSATSSGPSERATRMPTSTTVPGADEGEPTGAEPPQVTLPEIAAPAAPIGGIAPGPVAPGPTTGSINGTVTTDHDGAGPTLPVAAPGTPIRILDVASREVARSATDLAGRFAIGPIPPGSYRVLATEPVGMILEGALSSTDHGSMRREVQVATASVSAGNEAQVAVAFVPWRHLEARGGAASASSVRSGDLVSWTFELVSIRSTTTDVVAEVAFHHPEGAVLELERASTARDDRPAATRRSTGIAGGSDCEMEPGRTVTTVRCALGGLGPTPTPFTIQVRLGPIPAAGTAVPELGLSSSRAAVETRSLQGERVRLEA